jgi:hypothetical protein
LHCNPGSRKTRNGTGYSRRHAGRSAPAPPPITRPFE